MRLLILILFLVIIANSSFSSNKGQNPNVLIIVVDDMGWNGLSCYGQKPWSTPNIDRLAEKGIKFTNAYASPVCSPTRASILTGKNPARLHLTNWIPGWSEKYINPVIQEEPFQQDLPCSEFTIAEAMKNGGYETAMVGKWHLGEDPKYSPDKQGFDYQYMVSTTNLSQYFVEDDFDQIRGFYKEDENGRKFLTEHLTDKAINWISKPKDKPWFMYFATHVVHKPIAAKTKLIREYEKKGVPSEGVDAADYAAMHQHMDDAIGRLLDNLKTSGVEDNTLIVFISDNGGREPQTTNTPFRGGKGELLEGGIRVPLIFFWNGKIKAGKVDDTPVITDDLFPTIIDMVGLSEEKYKTLDGISLKPIILENQPLPERSLCWHYPHYNGHPYGKPSSAIRKGDWKLIHLLEDDTKELYNLKNDKGEEINLVNDNPGIATSLYEELEQWRRDLKVQMPDRNPKYDPNKESGWLIKLK